MTAALAAYEETLIKDRAEKFAALDAYVERLTGGAPCALADAFGEVKAFRDQAYVCYSDPERTKKIARLVTLLCDDADPFHNGELLEGQTDVFVHIHTMIGLI